MTTDTYPPQLTLPGQAHAAEGPYDQTGMYVMHHAFRRDLDDFVTAARNTPVGDVGTWRALERRWARFAEILHHHHEIEDTSIWPVLVAHADAAGRAEDRATLDAMEDEHAVIDPALTACSTAFTEMEDHPCSDHRNALDVRLTAVRESLGQHLRHEETEALPLLQRTMTLEEWQASEKYAANGYPPRVIPFLVPWAFDRLPDDARRRILDQAGPVYAVIHRLTRRRYARRQAEAFRYV